MKGDEENVKVGRGSTFTFTRDLPYIVSILFYFILPVYALKNYATVEIHLYGAILEKYRTRRLLLLLFCTAAKYS